MLTNDNLSNVESDLLEQFYKDMPSALAGNVLNAVVLVAVMAKSIPSQYLIFWLASMLAIILFRFGLYRRFQSATNKNKSYWKVTAIAAMAVTGIMWATLPPLVIGFGTTIHLSFLTLIIAGITAGALSSGSAFRTAYVLFVTPPILSLFIVLLFQGEADYYAFAALVPIFIILLLRSNNEYHHTLRNSLTLRHSNTDLVQQMAQANHELQLEVTKQKEISDRLAESEAMFRSLAESSDSTILVYGEPEKIFYINPAGENLIGHSAETIMQKPFGHFVHPDDREMILNRAKKRLAGEEVPNHYQLRIIDSLGKTHWIDLSVALITYEGHSAAIATGINISHLKESEKLLVAEKERAEKANQAKSEFLSSMSHELRTPLNAILGFTQLLESDPDTPLTQSQQENVKYIHQGGLHLLELINQVLELSKIESGKLDINLQDLSISNVIQECLPLLQSQATKMEVNLILENPHSDTIVKADRTLLKQVILNLVTNAIKYNKPGGSVTINCCVADNDYFKITITDTGLGIPQDKQAEIFTAFSRLGQENSRIEGTGIGLTITKRIVEAMHGQIGFESTEGEGSQFWFELPQAKRKET